MNEHDLRDLLSMMGGKKFRRRGQELLGSCPFRKWTHSKGTDNKPSFEVEVNDVGISRFVCFTCGIKGLSVNHLIERFNNYVPGFVRSIGVDLAESIEGELDLAIKGSVMWAYNQKRVKFEQRRVEMEQFWSEKELEGFDDYCDYLRDRGINKETAKRLQILYDPMMEEVLFPVRNKKGRLLGLQARSTNSFDKRNILRFKKSGSLYGEHLVERDKNIPVFLVEGPFDLATVIQAGHDCLAILGSFISEDQLMKIRAINRTVMLMLDGDKEGRKAADRAEKKFDAEKVIYDRVDLPDGKDPNSLGAQWIKKNFSNIDKQVFL